jgi:hypothetical protein
VTGEPTSRRYLLRAIVAVVAVALVFAVVLANRYRDSIALEVANRFLADSDVTVTDVSVESIRADEVRFEALVLELASGALVRVEGITLPVNYRGFANTLLHVESVLVAPGEGPSEPLRLADSIRAFLDAPAATPGGTIIVDELLVPGLPPVRKLGWFADRLNPTLRASIGGFELFLTLTGDSDDQVRGTFRALTAEDVESIMLAFRLRPVPAGFALPGTLSLQLEPLLPVLHALGTVPGDVDNLAGSVVGNFELEITNDLPVILIAETETDAGLRLDYRAAEDQVVNVTVMESTPLHATFEYPSLQWTATSEAIVLAVETGDFEFPPLELRNTECRSGIRCLTKLATTIENASIGSVSIGRVAVDVNAFEFSSDDGEWLGASSEAIAALDELSVAGHRVVSPGVRAVLTASGQGISVSLDIGTPEAGITGHVEVEHDLARDAGVLRLTNTALDFALLNLSEAFLDWDRDLDVTSGLWRIESEVNWAIGDAGFAYTGSSRHSLDDLAGRYGETGFVDLDSGFEVAFDWQAAPVVSPATFEVALLDIGFPIENLRGRITPDADALAADFDSVSMTLLGGEVRVDPFRYELEQETNELLLHAGSIQLPLMVALANLETVEISGSVSGDIPVTLKNGTVIVDGGYLENDPPGGTIRYGAGAGIVDSESQLGIVTRTLENFEFNVLTSNVDYSEQGDLKLQMRLTGINPDVDPLQPVVLNLGIENNVPQMLRSLQATRSIESILEKKLGQ